MTSCSGFLAVRLPIFMLVASAAYNDHLWLGEQRVSLSSAGLGLISRLFSNSREAFSTSAQQRICWRPPTARDLC